MKKTEIFKVRQNRDRNKPVASRAPKPKRSKGKPNDYRILACRQVEAIQAQIEAVKPLYRKLDEYLAYLAGVDLKGTGYVMVDAFEGKGNTAWKSVAFRRYELVRTFNGGKK